jgi:murein DD-endopeptidase MepM/ murein hydrolase activator NlpD
VGKTLNTVIDPRDLRGDDRYTLSRSTGGAFVRLMITRHLDRYIVEPGAGGLTARREAVPVVETARAAAGRLEGSLWSAMRAQGLDAGVIVEFADIFAWTVDFLTEPREGDSFALTWRERRTPSGRNAGQTIESALYQGRNTGRHVAVLFQGEYYGDGGESLRKAFLHAPLDFRRISSGFSFRRFHPILRYARPHLGVDYAAPTGTPVSSVGEGTVVFKGWSGGYGNWLQIRHNGVYTSCYAHLSRYAKGIAKGAHVRQGQVVGYVGATGYATGPHLDFRMMKNGTFVNFLKLKFPPDKSVSPTLRPQFENLRDKLLPPLQRAVAALPGADTAVAPKDEPPAPALDTPL